MTIQLPKSIVVVIAYKLELRRNVYNLVRQMPKALQVQLFESKNVSRRTIHRAIAECGQGLPC